MRRTIVTLFLIISVLTLIAQTNSGKNRKEKRAEKNLKLEILIDSLVQSRNYTVEAQSAQPMGWQQIQLTSLYELKVRGDSVEVYLPYFGRAYAVDYASTEGGIKIKSDIKNYQLEKKRKRSEITFETQTSFDHYQFRISISISGFATIYVNSNNRQAINFNGVLKRPDF
ncbi:MAG: DUF4251 domain-containing protein [Prolixibacteraceae bacterium]